MHDGGLNITRRDFMGSASFLLVATLAGKSLALQPSARKRVAFLAGNPSHGYGEHAHLAGSRLLADRLNALPNVSAEVVAVQRIPDEFSFDALDALIIYGDGDRHHPMLGHEEMVRRLADRGAGLGFLHYALAPPSEKQYSLMLDAIGGYYEPGWSVNPIWEATFDKLPAHPITRGIKPFTIRDEWYYHMRFTPDRKGVQPLLVALPPAKTLERPDGPHSNNPHVRKAVLERKEAQIVAWAFERPNGGRGFGFTGGHFQWNWSHGGFRTLILNAIEWLAKIDVPGKGVESKPPTFDELKAGLGEPPNSFRPNEVKDLLKKWNPDDSH